MDASHNTVRRIVFLRSTVTCSNPNGALPKTIEAVEYRAGPEP
jgi:hypothetical protein